MVEIGLLTPNSRGFSPRDVQVVEAISRFRAGGYDEQIGFTVYDTLRYKRAMESLVTEEVAVVLERLAGELEPDAVVDLLEAGPGAAARLHRGAALQAADRGAPAPAGIP